MSGDGAEAFWVTARGRGEIRPLALAEPRDGEVLVRSLFSAVSRGSECLVFQGRVPPSQYQAMRAPHQDGDFPWPVKYGYSAVGLVEQGPADLRGRTVFCLHPHQSRFVVAESAVTPLPDGLPAGRAVLAANMETAVNALWDGAPRIGDRIAVVGGGTVGCLAAYLASRIAGCRVQLVDSDPGKAALAGALGAAFAAPPEADGDCDLVFHASGTPEGLATALALAGLEAPVVELSWFGDQAVPLPLGEAFHSKRLTLRASQVSRIAPAQRARWSHGRRLGLALALLRDERLDALITGESPFHTLPETMASLCNSSRGVVCHRISYPE